MHTMQTKRLAQEMYEPIKEDADNDQKINDRTRYSLLKASGKYSCFDILHKNQFDRTDDEEFYVFMFVAVTIPFFYAYDRISTLAICRCLKTQDFQAGEVIFCKDSVAE
jgi:hypothetical protein